MDNPTAVGENNGATVRVRPTAEHRNRMERLRWIDDQYGCLMNRADSYRCFDQMDVERPIPVTPGGLRFLLLIQDPNDPSLTLKIYSIKVDLDLDTTRTLASFRPNMHSFLRHFLECDFEDDLQHSISFRFQTTDVLSLAFAHRQRYENLTSIRQHLGETRDKWIVGVYKAPEHAAH